MSVFPFRVLGLNLLLVVLLCGCGYRIPQGDLHEEDPFFPGLSGDSGFTLSRQPIAGIRLLELRQLPGGDVELVSEGDVLSGDSIRSLFVQRFDSSGRERDRLERRIPAPWDATAEDWARCSDGRIVRGRSLLLEADPSVPPRRIESFEIEPDWMTRTFGNSFESLRDSLARIGDSLDRDAGSYLLHPRTDSLVGWFDSLVLARALREEGVDSFYRVDFGSWDWILGILPDRRVVRIEHNGALGVTAPVAKPCSSLADHLEPGNPLLPWETSVIENSSSGNHFVFGFHPQRMTYHRIRLQGREARFKIYTYSSRGEGHVPYVLRGAVTLPHSVWVVAGVSAYWWESPSPDSLFLLRASPAPASPGS